MMSVQTPSFSAAAGGRTNANDGLDALLAASRRRIRALLLLRFASRALLISSLVCLVSVGLNRLRVVQAAPSPGAIGGVIGFALILAVAAAFARRLSALDVAKLTERRADLKERLSSALEFQKARDDAEAANAAFYTEQLSDANRSAQGVSARALYPLRLTWELPVGLLATLLLFLVYFLPTLPAFWSPDKKRDFEEVKAQGINIVKLAQDTQKTANQQKLEETKKAAEEARKLGEAMQKGKLEKKQALVEMQKLTKKMEETQKRMAASLPPKSLEQAGDDFKKKLEQLQKDKEAEAAKKEGMKAEKGRKPGENPQDANPNAPKPDQANAPKPNEKASEAMKKMQEAMKEMAEAMKNSDNAAMQKAMEKAAQSMQAGQMSKQDMQQMAQMMQQAAQAMQNTSMQQQSQQMQQMAQMMQQSMSNLDPKTLQQMAQMMKQMAQNMGKNPGKGMASSMMDMKALQQLAEDLKNGRMTMAMSGMGNKPGMGQGGKGPGRGFNGSGGSSKPMKDPGNTKPRLTAMGQSELGKGIGKSGSAQEFAKYLAKSNPASKSLPNGKIAGTRSQKGQELSLPFTGDPESAQSSTPYYSNVYSTSKKQAESTLNKENIPAAYKEQVRKYFDTIRP